MDLIKGHKLLTAVLIFTVLVVIGIVAGKPENKPVSNENPYQSHVPTQSEEKKFDVVTFYDKVQTDMSRAQVLELAGKKPDNCTESTVAGSPTFEYCNWNAAFGAQGVAVIGFSNGTVVSKSKTGF